jgi:hypothetical protein
MGYAKEKVLDLLGTLWLFLDSHHIFVIKLLTNANAQLDLCPFNLNDSQFRVGSKT